VAPQIVLLATPDYHLSCCAPPPPGAGRASSCGLHVRALLYARAVPASAVPASAVHSVTDAPTRPRTAVRDGCVAARNSLEMRKLVRMQLHRIFALAVVSAVMRFPSSAAAAAAVAGGLSTETAAGDGTVTPLLEGPEEMLTAAQVQQSFGKVQTQQQPLSLGDLGRQLRHACGPELDLQGMGGVADGAIGGPPSKQSPRSENCEHYFDKIFPTAVEMLNQAPLDTSPQLSLVDAAFFDARLAAAARLQLSMDALVVPVQRLGYYLDHVRAKEASTSTSRGVSWWARPAAERHWPKSLVPMLVSHIFSGGDHVRWELEFARARRHLATEALVALQTGRPQLAGGTLDALSAALACQASLTDYAWWEDDRDTELIRQLSAQLANTDRSPDDRSARLLISVYATYRQLLPLLESWPSLPRWDQAFLERRGKGGQGWPFWQLWRLTVAEPRRERELSAAIVDPSGAAAAAAAAARSEEGAVAISVGRPRPRHECAVASDSVSCAVRSMYERSPYPRWSRDPPAVRWPAHPTDFLRAVGFVVPTGWPAVSVGRPLKVLWVGCGTGYMLTIFARHFGALVDIWALDLSLSSLGYAARRVDELGLRNVHFVRGDILALPTKLTAQAPFDFMESSGVIHHLKRPTEALTSLVALLRPAAPLNLALYSTIARRESVVPCRVAGKDFNVSSDVSVREFRRYLRALAAAHAAGEEGARSQWASEIVRTEDYASLTGTRDLCLHPQERTYTLLQLRKMLDKVGLRWLRFAPTFDRQAQALFEQRFGIGPFTKQATLKKWHEFERDHPKTFAAMYQFFVQRSR
jgi:SAM-dependent methyltransferase